MSRAGLLLSAAAMPAGAHLETYDPFRIGLYCAVDNGPHDYALCGELPASDAPGFAEAFRRHQPPTAYLRQLPNLAAAQVGIFLGVMGPTHAFTDSRAGGLHALDQAQIELEQGVVDIALVCGAFALDDPFVAMRARADAPEGSVLCEGAAALLVVAGDGLLTPTTIEGHWYANCHPLMELTHAE
jgi:acyl transferase domain-containing protein